MATEWSCSHRERKLLRQILYTIRSGGSSSSSSRYSLQGPVRVSVVVQDGDRPQQRTARSQVNAETGGNGGIERA
jgi:hypothetical protein